MKNKSLIIAAIALVLVVGVAAIAYPKLTRSYEESAKEETEIKEIEEAETEVTEAEVSDTEEADTDETEAEEVTYAPDFTVLDAEGNEVNLSDYVGKPIVLNFWATWCGPCQSELPAFNAKAEEYSDQVNFLLVNLTDGYRETVDGVKAFMEKNEYTFPVFYETTQEASMVYGIYSIPTTYFIDETGAIVSAYSGALSEEVLTQEIEKLLN
ncbi:MAG: TlpA family protein disulfide reductase [Pseudobutyrivibrio sp.]|nr:TlpA family protein disulfide reductase [Pseudobutyrivibrio sp.]